MRYPWLALVVVSSGLSGVIACSHGQSNTPDAPDSVVEITCASLPTPASGTCEVTAGGTTTLLEGNVLTPGAMYRGGQVAVDSTGTISCVGCDCAQGGETTIVCADGVISPGLINTHDHITYTHDPPG